MTLDEIRASDKLFLTAADIAPVLECNPQCIRITAREHPEALGFPVTVLGKKKGRFGARTLIPRLPFLDYVLGKQGDGGGAQ